MAKKPEVQIYDGTKDKAPHEVFLATTLITGLLKHGGLKSSYGTMEILAPQEIRYGIPPKVPKEMPPLVLVGTKSDLNQARVAISKNTNGPGFILQMESPEGKRTIEIDQQAEGDSWNNHSSDEMVRGTRLLSTGETTGLHFHERADLIVLFVSARLHDNGLHFSSINAFNTGEVIKY